MIKIIKPIRLSQSNLEFFAIERISGWLKAYVRHQDIHLRPDETNNLEFSKITFDVYAVEYAPAELINAKVIREVARFKLLKGDLT